MSTQEVRVGQTFKVPRGQELRFAGRIATVRSIDAQTVRVHLQSGLGIRKQVDFKRSFIEASGLVVIDHNHAPR